MGSKICIALTLMGWVAIVITDIWDIKLVSSIQGVPYESSQIFLNELDIVGVTLLAAAIIFAIIWWHRHCNKCDKWIFALLAGK